MGVKKIFKNPFNSFKKLLDPFLKNVNKSLWILGKNAFLFTIIFILLDIVFGEFLFYNYVVLVKMKESEIISPPAKFKEQVYQSVLGEWQAREENFKGVSPKNLQDPFL